MSANTENKMGTGKISRLVLQTGVPLMLSLLINSLYNFVDSVFVSHVSEDALTALSLASPVQMLMSAVGCGIAVGLNAVISKALGEKDREGVKRAASASLFLALCAGILLAVLGLTIVASYFKWQAGGNAVIEEYGTAYLQICMLFSSGQMGQWVFDRMVIASGRSSLFLLTLSAASITNLILDPILIFGWLGVPAMGTAGAALATVIGQCAGCAAGFLVNRTLNREIPIAFTLKPSWKSIFAILKVGIPTMLVQGVVSLLGIVMNSILIGFSTTAVAVYGVCLKIQGLATVGVHGITLGEIPLIAFNFGARKPERVHGTVKWAMCYGLGIFSVFLLALELLPAAILRLFDASPEMLAAGIPALRIFALTWLFSIPGMVLASAFQGLSKGGCSMALTLTKQAILPTAFVLAAASLHSLELVWLAFAAAELLSLPLGIILWRRVSGKTLGENRTGKPMAPVLAARK